MMDEIDNFFSSFEEMVETALKITTERHAVTFKKLVFFSILDGLSKTVETEKFSNFERFSRFIVRFCEWKHYSKVSVPHLAQFLRVIPNPEFEELRLYANQEIAEWKDGETITLARDIDKEIVLAKWPKDQILKEPLGKISIDSLTHISLLWKYRNALVHEARRLGRGMDSFSFEEPSYHSRDIGDKYEETNTWELVYPIPFFQNLTVKGIKNLKEYYRKNQLNPSDRYKFGSYWIENLNE